MPLGLAGSGITRIYRASWRDVRTTWQHDVAYRRTWQAFRQFRLLFVHVMLQELGYLGEHPAWRFECASDEFVAVASEAIGVARRLICGLVARTHFRTRALAQHAYLPHMTIAHDTEAALIRNHPAIIAQFWDRRLGGFRGSHVEVVMIDPSIPYPGLNTYAAIALRP